jgi:DNA-binding beta-propeller fold protein YncE
VSDNRFDFLEIGEQRPPRRVRARSVDPAGTIAIMPPNQRAVEKLQSWSVKWRVAEVIGERGSSFGQFLSPGGLATDREGALYVADSSNHRIQRISPEGDVSPLGEKGSGPGQFSNPQAIVVDHELRIYVLEQGNARVQVLDAEGNALGSFGKPGFGASEFHGPTGMALGPCGSLFIADPGNRRITKWARYGQPLGLLALTPTGGPWFDSPQGVAVDSSGRVYVADRFKNAVLVFNSDFEPEQVIGGLREPQDLAVDAFGRIFVTEAGADRVQILDPKGRSLQVLDSGGEMGRFAEPSGVTVTSNGTVYVADTSNHRLFRLEPVLE